MASFRSKWMLLAVLVFLVVLLDQASKVWITVSLPLNGAIPVVDGFFNIVHVQNPGGAFGFLSEGYSDFKRTFFLAGTLVAAVVLMLVFRKLPAEYVFLRAGIALILGGAAGNFIDRLRQGRVVDFLDFYIGDLHWPAFNVADSAVTAGAVIFLFHLIFKKIPD
ncbi:MAG: signal peptidase II [Deltaproteobacteria bacterium]|nr:signal peptidase II [Deltaproteobacteria bacterium]MBW1955568.1 signal peptidase II [Deltaproteobacteria bacterium]MBW2043072.1 signal peptidase II [Deltaproteobacteria bacterium]MBW2133420.1 signal peptidase II [Deltaproteobacteria bacterium]